MHPFSFSIQPLKRVAHLGKLPIRRNWHKTLQKFPIRIAKLKSLQLCCVRLWGDSMCDGINTC